MGVVDRDCHRNSNSSESSLVFLHPDSYYPQDLRSFRQTTIRQGTFSFLGYRNVKPSEPLGPLCGPKRHLGKERVEPVYLPPPTSHDFSGGKTFRYKF